MFCGFGKKNRNNKDGKAPVPMPAGMSVARKEPKEQANDTPAATPIDLRAEKDEPSQNNVKLMDYLQTEVVTKQNEKRWVQRLFVLN